jgi:hypothetical protein
MMKFVVTIGYTDYLVSEADAAALLGIASRSVELTRPGYTGPYYPKPNAMPFATAIKLDEVNEEPLPKADPMFAEVDPPLAQPISDKEIPF